MREVFVSLCGGMLIKVEVVPFFIHEHILTAHKILPYSGSVKS